MAIYLVFSKTGKTGDIFITPCTFKIAADKLRNKLMVGGDYTAVEKTDAWIPAVNISKIKWEGLRPVYMRGGMYCVDMNDTYTYVGPGCLVAVNGKMYTRTCVVEI